MKTEKEILDMLTKYNKAESLIENQQFDRESYQDITKCDGFTHFRKYGIKLRSIGGAYPNRTFLFWFEKFNKDAKIGLLMTDNHGSITIMPTPGIFKNNYLNYRYFTFADALRHACWCDSQAEFVDFNNPEVKNFKVKLTTKPLFETESPRYTKFEREPARAPYALRETINLVANGIRGVNHRCNKHTIQAMSYKTERKEFAKLLAMKEREIAQCKTFDELYAITRANIIKGIGDLTCYDTTCRLGYYLNLVPTDVYLHAGTYKGLENLCNCINHDFTAYRGQHVIPRNELPRILVDSDLTAPMIEDFLCRFDKDDASLNDLTAYPH